MTRRKPVEAASSGQRRWASLATAARHADLSIDTVRRYVASGYLTGYRSPNGKTIRVDLTELDEMFRAIPSGRSA